MSGEEVLQYHRRFPVRRLHVLGAQGLPMRLTQFATGLVLLIMLVPLLTVGASNDSTPTQGRESTLVVSEIFISPNNLVSNDTTQNIYGAVDWNGDGEYGKYSDQFIELWNTGSTGVDVSDWILSITSGSAPCQLAWNTTVPADGRIVIFSADSGLMLDYFDGETVSVSDTSGSIMDTMTVSPQFAFWGNSVVEDSSGTLIEVTPTPGFGPEDPASNTAVNIVKCYKVQEQSSEAYILKGRVVTMENQDSVFNQGNVLIRDGKIEGVWSSDLSIPANVDLTNVPVIETNGTIYPGLIDLHNHMHYNHIPLWDFEVHLNENQRSDEGGYTNRYQWGNNWDYGPSITWMKTNVQSYNRWDMASEQMKYAEVQAVSGGVTAVQGSPGSNTDAWDSMLSRNIELYNFGQDGITTCAVCGAADSDYTGSHLISQNESGSLNGWFVHLAEGVDSSSKAEFDALWDKGLIMDETVVIHGTALDRAQFDKMATVGSDLVWSPISNLLLYGNTTNVRAADAAGVPISIAPDWGPSGSKNNLHELKVADLWNRDVMDSYFSDYDMAKMVTSNPAKAAKWDSFVGQLKAGMYADIVVMDTFHEDPYRNLIESIDADVRLTVVQGKAVFGDVDIMTAINQDDWEAISGGGVNKAVDVTSLTETDGSQTWASIEEGMTMAMQNNFEDIKAHWNDVSGMSDAEINTWLGSSFDGDYKDNQNRLKNMTVDPIFTTGDERYFDVINRSSHGNTHVDLTQLYAYYDIEMDADGNRIGVDVNLGTDTEDNTGSSDNTGGNTGGNSDGGNDGSNTNDDSGTNDGTTNNGGDQNNADNGDGTTIVLCDDGSLPPCIVNPNSGDDGSSAVDSDASDSEDIKQKALLAMVGIMVVMGLGLFLISKTGGDDLNLSEEARIEKIWDESELEPSSTDSVFIPAPPPMDAMDSAVDEAE